MIHFTFSKKFWFFSYTLQKCNRDSYDRFPSQSHDTEKKEVGQVGLAFALFTAVSMTLKPFHSSYRHVVPATINYINLMHFKIAKNKINFQYFFFFFFEGKRDWVNVWVALVWTISRRTLSCNQHCVAIILLLPLHIPTCTVIFLPTSSITP